MNLSIKHEDYNDGFVQCLSLIVNENVIKIKLNENNIIELNIPLEEQNALFTQFKINSIDLINVIKTMDSIYDYIFLRVNLDHIVFECNGIYASSKMVYPNKIIQMDINSIILPIII